MTQQSRFPWRFTEGEGWPKNWPNFCVLPGPSDGMDYPDEFKHYPAIIFQKADETYTLIIAQEGHSLVDALSEKWDEADPRYEEIPSLDEAKHYAEVLLALEGRP